MRRGPRPSQSERRGTEFFRFLPTHLNLAPRLMYRRRGVKATPTSSTLSLDRDVRVLDHLRPLGSLGGDELRELFGRVTNRLSAHGLQLLLHGGLFHDSLHLAAQLVHDLGRGP